MGPFIGFNLGQFPWLQPGGPLYKVELNLSPCGRRLLSMPWDRYHIEGDLIGTSLV